MRAHLDYCRVKCHSQESRAVSNNVELVVPDMAAWLQELASLPATIQRRVVKGAVATGCSVMRKDAKLRAPKKTGNLAKAIYQVRLKEESDETLEVWKVDVARGKQARNDAYYAKWVEYGHYTRGIGGARFTKAERRVLYDAKAADRPVLAMNSVAGAKWVPAQPFMRPAFLATREQALKAMSDYFRDNLQLALATSRYFKAIS